MKKHPKTIEQEVINFIKRHQLFDDEKKILIALSGGADSVFALYFFHKYSNKYNITIAAAHVNHSLRGSESLRDKNFCRKLCGKLDLEFYSKTVNVKSFAKKNKYSIEEAARILRYKKLEEILAKSKSELIVTAHNADDNSETVLLNIVNGTGLEGLSGISVKRENIIRPFLCLSKEQITEYLKSENIDFVEDSTNNDLSFRRNFIRKEILPKLLELNPSLNRVVLNTSEVFSNQKRVLDYFINELFEKIVSKKGKDFLIDLSELKKYPNEVLGEILKLTFEDLLKLDFNYNDFLQFQDLISKQVGTKLEFSQKFAAIKDRGQIRIVKNSKSLNNIISVSLNSNTQIDGKILEITELKEIPLKIVRNKNEEILCADKLEKKLKLRRWKNGDKIQLLGMKGTKKISDVLTDLKIPSSEKENQMVLLNGNDIVYLVGLKISEKYKVTEETKSAVKICLK